MKQKYNIALIPSENKEEFIDFAKQSAQNFPDGRYMLGEQSFPHVTLCHFEAYPDQIDKIWEQVQALDLPTTSLDFDTERHKSFPGHPKDGGVRWVSLISDKLDILKEMHLQVAQIIKKPLNGAYENYDPHMTLFNSRLEDVSIAINDHIELPTSLHAECVVALGKLDNVGQITEIIYESEPRFSLTPH